MGTFKPIIPVVEIVAYSFTVQMGIPIWSRENAATLVRYPLPSTVTSAAIIARSYSLTVWSGGDTRSLPSRKDALDPA